MADEPSSQDPDSPRWDRFVAEIAGAQAGLRAFLRSLLPCPGDADDVLQETNLVLWRKREEFDEDDFFSLWVDTHGREDASHSGAPTLGIREGRFFARLDLDHSAAAGRAADGGTFLLAARHAWIAEEGRARIELWVDPVPGAPHDAAANGPHRPDGPPAYRFLGLRMGKHTEVSDRLLVRGLALGRSLESVLEALAE